ncbi:Fur-regulated basic protein B [Bacillus sp. 491mf]|nr:MULTISPECIES: FbpB family small basic protein [unclassified Bacillus (in: firmicutes)]SFD08708.1 Fur-regulated basic protein B [Bacillus sp. 491mf]
MKKHSKLGNKSFKELVQENKQNILNDKQAMERIEQRIEQRYETKKSAS